MTVAMKDPKVLLTQPLRTRIHHDGKYVSVDSIQQFMRVARDQTVTASADDVYNMLISLMDQVRERR